MRVLVVWPGATWSTADVARGWANGLQAAGADVIRFRLDQRLAWLADHMDDDELRGCAVDNRRRCGEMLAGALYEYRPDLVVVIDGKDIPPEVIHGMRQRGEKIVLIHTESPYEDERIESMWWCADWHLVNDPAGVDRIRKHTANVHYTPHAYDPAVHYPATTTTATEHDVVFVGSGFSGRASFLAAVPWATVGRLTLAGHWRHIAPAHLPPALEPHVADLPEPLPNEDAADLYRTSKVGLNLYRTDFADADAVGWAMGPREVEMAACGLFFLRQPRPEGDGVFPMLPCFSSPEELADLASWWLAHDGARLGAADAARRAVCDRTFDRHAASLLRRVA